ncbi:unnamed protein product [Brachionus calyciflorus]|uniref:Integrase catalytic domain-containing protein n=1 Tax=Brachionus calyciflorus TaxID=104777 RepID=A0A814C5Z6_9BILA|nr:unnamed protein product [Brachionus calyciflorus]
MLESNLIRPSKSAYSSPVHLVKKADRSIRLTIDYRELNKLTVRDCYLLSRVDVLLYSLKKAKVISKLDLLSGYFQITVEENSKKYTAFTCEFGHFEFNVMPMGQTNLVATFQRFMDKIFKKLIGICCWVYLEVVAKNEEPKNVEETLAFIGLTSHYRNFVKDYGKIAYPLHSQKDEDYSRKLSKTEQRYSTSEKKMLAIVNAMEDFKKFLYGNVATVITDHQPLKWINTVKNPTPRLARRIIRLEMFDFDKEYRPGSKNGNADGLSRWPFNGETETSQEDEYSILNNVVYENEPFDKLETIFEEEEWTDIEEENNVINTSVINTILFKNVEENVSQKDDEDIKWIKKVIENKVGSLEYDKNSLNNDRIVYLREKENLKIDRDILYRDIQEGENKVVQFVVPKTDREKIIEHEQEQCTICQKTSDPQRTAKIPLSQILCGKPLEIITTDILGPLKTSRNGYKYILVVVDHFTKWLELYLIRNIDAKTTAKCLLDFICRFGIPDAILSDQGRNNQAQLLDEIWQLLDVQRLRTTPFHPKCDGLSERINRTVKRMITCFINESHDD